MQLESALYEKYMEFFIKEYETQCIKNIAYVISGVENENEIHFSDAFTESVYECLIFNSFDDAKLIVYEYGYDGIFSKETVSELINIISEAEEDHKMHMDDKKSVASALNKNVDDLKNKKYKTKKDGTLANPEKSKKADLKYKAKEMVQKTSDGGSHYNVSRANDQRFNGEHIEFTGNKQSDIKLLEYMKKKAQKAKDGDEVSIKNYKRAFKIFCSKYNIDPESDIYIKFHELYKKGDDGKMHLITPTGPKPEDDKLHVVVHKTYEKIDSKRTQGKEQKHALPNGYVLIHGTKEDGLKELKPTMTSGKYAASWGNRDSAAGQYHDTGKVYFVLKKKDTFLDKFTRRNTAKSSLTDTKGYDAVGGLPHVYQLISPIDGFYLDGTERYDDYKADSRYASIDKLVDKPVFVKTDKPLKVKQLK